MRGTFTHANPDFTNDVFHMADLGFTELSMEPVVCAPGDPSELTEEEKGKLETAKEALKEALKGEDIDAIKAKQEALQKEFYPIAEKMYQNAAPQDGQAGPQAGNDGVVDADFETVD